MHEFFVRKFVQSQNVTRKKTFVQKMCTFNVDEIDTGMIFFFNLASIEAKKSKLVCTNLYLLVTKWKVTFYFFFFGANQNFPK